MTGYPPKVAYSRALTPSVPAYESVVHGVRQSNTAYSRTLQVALVPPKEVTSLPKASIRTVPIGYTSRPEGQRVADLRPLRLPVIQHAPLSLSAQDTLTHESIPLCPPSLSRRLKITPRRGQGLSLILNALSAHRLNHPTVHLAILKAR